MCVCVCVCFVHFSLAWGLRSGKPRKLHTGVHTTWRTRIVSVPSCWWIARLMGKHVEQVHVKIPSPLLPPPLPYWGWCQTLYTVCCCRHQTSSSSLNLHHRNNCTESVHSWTTHRVTLVTPVWTVTYNVTSWRLYTAVGPRGIIHDPAVESIVLHFTSIFHNSLVYLSMENV